jgi:signal transduction histidine kinase
VKHSAATEVTISLKIEPVAFVLTVQDNGRGLYEIETNPANPTGGQGNGLANLRCRLSSIGGNCEISSRHGEGTTVSFRCPMPHARKTTSGSGTILVSNVN